MEWGIFTYILLTASLPFEIVPVTAFAALPKLLHVIKDTNKICKSDERYQPDYGHLPSCNVFYFIQAIGDRRSAAKREKIIDEICVQKCIEIS